MSIGERVSELMFNNNTAICIVSHEIPNSTIIAAVMEAVNFNMVFWILQKDEELMLRENNVGALISFVMVHEHEMDRI